MTDTALPARPRLDFGDWLSPMLVKELRQGMRSRVFVISFLLLQLAMLLLAIVGLTASSFDQGTAAVTGFFWAIVAMPLLLVMPATGLNAVADEAKANTLELIFLTRLSARRIVFGKWIGLVAQSILLVCAVLPYAVLRYFLGGVDLMTEALMLLVLCFVSALLTAVTVGLSPLATKLLRVLMSVGFILCVNFMGLSFLAMSFGGGGFWRGGPSWNEWLAGVLPALAVMAFMLEIGAAKLAPAAENHTTPLRAIALAAFLAGLAVLKWSTEEAAATALVTAGVLLLVVVIVGLCERPERPLSLYRPFVRYGGLGRLAGRFFYPGWPSAVFFSLLVTGLFVGLGLLLDKKTPPTPGVLVVSIMVCLGALWTPTALIQFFWPDARRPAAWYFILMVASALFYWMTAVVHALKGMDLRPLARLVPPAGVIALLSESEVQDAPEKDLLGTAVVSALMLVLLLWKMRHPWRALGAAERTVAAWETDAAVTKRDP